MGLGRVELPTSPLSGVRSNQLSYRPGLDAGPSKLGSEHPRPTPRNSFTGGTPAGLILRKEVIQPQVPLRLPCYGPHPYQGCALTN